jgi:alpha-galactosidase
MKLYFKIDGIEIRDKLAEINLQRFFDKVKRETQGAVFFNLDLTAGNRGGYFMFRNVGNFFSGKQIHRLGKLLSFPYTSELMDAFPLLSSGVTSG